jgi:hypothetical protein
MVGHIQSKRQQKLKNKAKKTKPRTSLKMRKTKAPTELRVKRGKSKAFDEVLSTGRLTGRANSFLKSSGASSKTRGGGAGKSGPVGEEKREADKWRPANPVLTAEFPQPMPLSLSFIQAARRANANRITAQNRGP